MFVKDLPYPLGLCVELLWHAGVLCEKTQDMKASQIQDAVSVFFDEAIVKEANDIICGRSVNVRLPVYCSTSAAPTAASEASE